LITLTILGEEYKPCSSSLCSFLQPPVTSSLLGPNILRSTLFSNTLNLCSPLNVRDQVSHPYKTTVKTVQRMILIYSVTSKHSHTTRLIAIRRYNWWETEQNMASTYCQNKNYYSFALSCMSASCCGSI
jgi:hypothetical protein